jgi:hypothetical protein
MIRHIWSVLCQSASFDVQTNNVSLLNIVEAITVSGDLNPAHPAIVQAELVSLWHRENIDTAASGKMRLFYIDPNGNQSNPIFLPIDLTRSPFHRTRINIPGLPIISRGSYTFNVEYQLQDRDEWSLVAQLPLVVLVQPPQPAP